MSAGTYDLQIEAGATFSRTFTWQTGSPLAAVNLTGYTAHAQIRDANGAVLVDLTQASGLVLGGSAGTIALTITAAQTASMVGARPFEWDLKLTAADGVTVTRLLQGKVVGSAQVTV